MDRIEYVFDDPVPYKTLRIYPIKMRDYFNFNVAVKCLLLDKNSIPDSKIISMSYLEYLYSLIEKDKDYIIMLDYLFKMCFGLSREDPKAIDYKYDDDKNPFFEIDGNKFYSDDFDEINKIICEQNLIEVIDENISKEARNALGKAKKYREKINNSGRKMASFEDQMIALSISTGLKLEDIYNLTIRKFNKMLERIDLKLHYEIYLSASLSGFVEFKDKSVIQHWLTEINHDKYENVLMETDEVKNKLK